MDWIALAVYLIVTGSLSAALYFVANRKGRASYEEDSAPSEDNGAANSDSGVPPRFSRLNVVALSVSIFIGAVLSVLQSQAQLDLIGLSFVAVGVAVTFPLVVSIYTDHRYRMVDRVMLRASIVVALAFGAIALIQLQNEAVTILYVVSLLVSFAVMFVPSVGASDSRAFVLFFASSIPVLGLVPTYYAFLGGIGLWVAYGIIFALINRSMKVSIPMVPYILAPFVIGALAVSVAQAGPTLLENIGF